MSLINQLTSNVDLMTKEELEIEYCNLKSQNNVLTKQVDTCMQQLHETKRQLETSKAMGEHLLSEIETLQTSELQNSSQKIALLEEAIAHLKQENRNIIQNYESQLSNKDTEIQQLNEQFNSKQKVTENCNQNEVSEYKDEILNLQTKIELLSDTIVEIELKYSEAINENTCLENRISELSCELNELRQCLERRTHELHESKDFITNLQDEQMLMQLEIDRLKNVPAEKAEKGNSLFAEVDDNRQELQKYIQNINKRYMELKSKYNNKADELKKMNLEYATLAKLLDNNQDNIESTNELIASYKRHNTKLTENVEYLENEINRRRNAYSKLMKGDIKSAETMIDITRKEVLTLRRNLLAESLAVNLKEKALHEIKIELGKWQAEAMKLRVKVMSLNQNIEKSELEKNETDDNICNKQSLSTQSLTKMVFVDEENESKNDSSLISQGEISNLYYSQSLSSNFKDISLEEIENKFTIKSNDISINPLSSVGNVSDFIAEHILTPSNKLFNNINLEENSAEEKCNINMEVENIENQLPDTKTENKVKNKKVAFSECTLEPKLTNRPRRGGKIIVVPCVHIPSVIKKEDI